MSDDKEYQDPKEMISTEVGITKIDLTAPAVSISEVLDEIAPQGTETTVADFVDMPIVIRSIRFFKGQFGPAAFVIFTDENDVLYNFIVGQKIVLPKLVAVEKYLPVKATITRHEGGQFEHYYDIE